MSVAVAGSAGFARSRFCPSSRSVTTIGGPTKALIPPLLAETDVPSVRRLVDMNSRDVHLEPAATGDAQLVLRNARIHTGDPFKPSTFRCCYHERPSQDDRRSDPRRRRTNGLERIARRASTRFRSAEFRCDPTVRRLCLNTASSALDLQNQKKRTIDDFLIPNCKESRDRAGVRGPDVQRAPV
jgi:hypothetical protein